jgi:hypothetical protein
MMQRWCSAVQTAELVALINLLIEAAGPRRVEWLDDLIVQVDNQRRRSGAWKMNRLKQYAETMRKDPRHLPRLRKLRGWPDSKVVLKILEAAARGMSADEILPAFRRHRAITRGALVNVLISMTRNGLIERYSDGIYGVPRSVGEHYESIPRRIFKLALAVPETTRAALIGATGCSSGSVSGAIDNLRKRGLFDPSVVAVSAEARAKAERGETIFNKKGKVFWAPAPEVPPSDAQRVDAAVFTTLHPDRPRVDREARAQKLTSLRTLKGEQLKSAVAITAKELAWDPGDLVERLPKSAQRYLRNETARERWREKLTRMMQESPKRSPKPLPNLFKDAHEAGVSRRVCKDMIREVTAALRQKGLETSWSDPGAPKRG